MKTHSEKSKVLPWLWLIGEKLEICHLLTLQGALFLVFPHADNYEDPTMISKLIPPQAIPKRQSPQRFRMRKPLQVRRAQVLRLRLTTSSLPQRLKLATRACPAPWPFPRRLVEDGQREKTMLSSRACSMPSRLNVTTLRSLRCGIWLQIA